MIFALFISFIVFKYFRHKTDQSILNDTINQTDQNLSPYEMATESPSTRQGNNAIERIETAESMVYFQKEETLPNAYDCMQPIDQKLYVQVMTNGGKSIISTEYKNQ